MSCVLLSTVNTPIAFICVTTTACSVLCRWLLSLMLLREALFAVLRVFVFVRLSRCVFVCLRVVHLCAAVVG